MANFDLAPPPKTVDGLLAVPVDISSIDATFVFDGAASSATADATITYTVGPTAGNPIFDLRQAISQAWLDGVPFAPELLAHHPFGTGPFTDLRVIESVQAAGSVHTLRVVYGLAMPDSQLGGAYLPALEWSAGPRLRFVFGLSDLNRARYVEAWLPANLPFDQYAIDLDLQVTGTMAGHAVITNGTATEVGPNHWTIAFPSRFTAVSPLLEVRAADTVEQATATEVLPVSGKAVAIEAWKPQGAGTDLAEQIAVVGSHLAANEAGYGPYLHGERFVAFFNGGGMEYEGGTTTTPDALEHETFHSWYARGIKPASQADGWWDEAFTSFHDDGADDAVPFDFTDPPVTLCSRDPWQRHTPTSAYTEGNAFFKGLASLIGVGILNGLMGDLYEADKGKAPVSTARIEEFLLSRSGNPQVVGAFHRFVYGLADPQSQPDLWLRDAPADPGDDEWSGAFWDSPDLWVRNHDDGVSAHQSPEYGQDNWFYARVRNKAAAAAAHFVVSFHAKGFAGTEFVFPSDFLPSLTAKAEFDLPAGGSRVVKARWPKSQVPPAGAHTCVLAAVLARSGLPVAGRHVWEDNNLAQKNLTVVDLLPDSWLIVPVVVSNRAGLVDDGFDLQVLARPEEAGLEASLVHASKALLEKSGRPVQPFRPCGTPDAGRRRALLDCGGRERGAPDRGGALLTSEVPELAAQRFPNAWELAFTSGCVARLPVRVEPSSQMVVGLKVTVPHDAKPGRSMKLHLVQRHRRSRRVMGGVAVLVNVREP